MPLLLLGATAHDGAGEDLGTGDERAADAERTAAQLLGRHDHAHVVALAARREPAVLLGHRQPEPAHLGQAGDHVLGHVGVGAVDVLGDGLDAVLGEPAERVADELEVGVEVARSLLAGEVGEEVGVAIRGEERTGRVERAGLDGPLRLAAEHPRREVVHGVGDERAGDAAFDVTLRAVVEERSRDLDGGGGVGEVVEHDLLLVSLGEGSEVPRRLLHDRVGQLDDGCGSAQVRGGHAGEASDGEVSDACWRRSDR